MFAARTVRFALVAAVLSSLTNAAPLFNFSGRKEAVAMVRRAENDGQLAQGTNYFFTTLHLEDACAPGQVACVSGNYATCSGEGNWEITPCTSGSTCLATPASSPSGISIQCTSQESAQSSIQNAGGDPNTIAADFHVTDAPFSAATVPDPSASSSASDTATATESTSAPTETATASPTDLPSESASATEASESSTCTPDEGDDGTIADGPTETASPSATETPEPTETCTEEPIETETITVIVVPVPSSTGVYSTTTLFPEVPEPTVVGTDVPVPTESSSSTESAATESASSTEGVPTESQSSSESAPTESSSSDESTPTESSSSAESTSTDSSSSSEATVATEVSSSSGSVATVSTIFIEPGYSIPALPTGAGDATNPVAIPVVSVVGSHTVPAKRMVRVVRRA